VITRNLLKSYLSNLRSRVSITFDGWTNDSLQSFYSITLHFCDHESKSAHCILLDFLKVQPGLGVGGRLAAKVYSRLKTFGLDGKLLAAVTDNGADAVKAAQCLSENYLDESGSTFLRPEHHIRYSNCILN